MPRSVGRSWLSDPVKRFYDVSKHFKITRYMDGALKDGTKLHKYVSEADLMRHALDHFLKEGLTELSEEDRKRQAIKYEIYKYEERKKEREKRSVAINNLISKLRKLKQKRRVTGSELEDVKSTKRMVEYLKDTPEEEDESTQELEREWKKFCETKRGKQILDKIEKRSAEDTENE